jgi:hypothetical protein
VKFKTAILYICLGWLLSRIILSFVRLSDLGTFVLLPGFLLAIVYLFVVTDRLVTGRGNLMSICFLSGVVADSILYWVLRPGMGSAFTTAGPWDSLVVKGSVACLIIFSGLSFIVYPLGKTLSKYDKPISGKMVIAALFLFVLVIVAYRLAYAFTKHLPNDARSIFIMGCEIHHANWGILAFLIMGMLLVSRPAGTSRILFLVSAVFAAFFFDQISYIQLQDVTDEAYGGAISLFGSIAGGIMYAAFVVLRQRSTFNRNGTNTTL